MSIMSCTRKEIVTKAQAWVGLKESDGSHKKVIDTYNSHKPLARGYKLQYTDSWCSGFVSAVAIACGATDIIPTEVGCQKHIDLFKANGIWVENDSYVPLPGDYIFYDWQDNGTGDNMGNGDHVGIVEKVENGVITVIEGNYYNSVDRRTIEVNGRYIRGYGVPKYDEDQVKQEPATVYYSVRMPRLSKGSKGEPVKTLQILLIGYKYSCGAYGADGDFGSATDAAIRRYQKAHGLSVDGVVGPATWKKLLGV
jgi:hypothetical protein